MGIKFEKGKKNDLAEWTPEPEPERLTYGPGVNWSGHFTDYSGYAKANREIMFRVANVVKVNLLTTGLEEGLIQVDRHTRRRVEVHRNVKIHERSPLLRFFGPDYMPKEKGHKIVWTMMETYKIHHQMIAMVNQSYDELWTPTEWNRQVFIGSGARVPSRVVPLGVNKSIYRPMRGNKLPPCRRVTTEKAGEIGNPSGFIFLTLGLPSFRKGFDVLVEAFDKVFADRDDVHLVLAVTHSLPEWNKQVYKQFAGRKTSIWTLEGQYNEHEMAKIYCASNAYVSASRGEGWNLPAQEAAACGIPVIVPENTSHAEVIGKAGWTFPIEGLAPSAEAKKVSMWYEGMPFAVFGKKSIAGLAEAMETVLAGGAEVDRRREELLLDMRMRFSWDLAAMRVIDRLLEVQP